MLATRSTLVAAYRRALGCPIWPLSLVRRSSYPAYRQGVQSLEPMVFVNGERWSRVQVSLDPRLASVLSDEGAVAPVHALLPETPWRRPSLRCCPLIVC